MLGLLEVCTVYSGRSYCTPYWTAALAGCHLISLTSQTWTLGLLSEERAGSLTPLWVSREPLLTSALHPTSLPAQRREPGQGFTFSGPLGASGSLTREAGAGGCGSPLAPGFSNLTSHSPCCRACFLSLPSPPPQICCVSFSLPLFPAFTYPSPILSHWPLGMAFKHV